jgi:hypothetical protein
MNPNFKTTKAYRDYLKGPLDDFDFGHHRGDEWSGDLHKNLILYYHADEKVPYKGEDE